MTFEDALLKLKAGRRLARKNWVDLRILCANHIVIELTDDEYAADDYEFQASDYDSDSLDANLITVEFGNVFFCQKGGVAADILIIR